MTFVMSVAGGVVALSDEAIAQMLVEMHCDGTVAHSRVGYYAGKALDLQTAAPVLRSSPTPVTDGRLQFQVSAQVNYHDHPMRDPAASGLDAVTDVTISAFLESKTTADGRSVMVVDWSPTREQDIEVHAESESTAFEIKTALFFLVKQYGGCLFEQTSDTTARRQGVVAWGALEKPTVLGSPAEALVGNLMPGECAVLIKREHLERDLRRAFRKALGGVLPLPNGPISVSLNEEPIGDLGFDTGEQAHRRRLIEYLNVRFGDGVAELEFHIGESSAWGGRTRTEVAKEKILLDGPSLAKHTAFPVLLNSDGSNVEQVITETVEGLLAGRSPAERRVLSALAALLSVTHRRSVEVIGRKVHKEGMVLRLRVTQRPDRPPPLAQFVTLPGGHGLERIFHGGESWAPGGQIQRYRWDFGDGSIEETSDKKIRFVTRHSYSSPGTYHVILTVTDDVGRTAAVNQSVTVGELTIVDVQSPTDRRVSSQAGSLIEFVVLDGTGRVSDVTVEVRIGNAHYYTVTDAVGRAKIYVAEGAEVKRARVTARKQGYSVVKRKTW